MKRQPELPDYVQGLGKNLRTPPFDILKERCPSLAERRPHRCIVIPSNMRVQPDEIIPSVHRRADDNILALEGLKCLTNEICGQGWRVGANDHDSLESLSKENAERMCETFPQSVSLLHKEGHPFP